MFSGKSLSLKSSAGSITKPAFELLRVGEVEPVAMIILFVSNSLLSTRIEFADTILASPFIISTPFFFSRNSTPPVSFLTLSASIGIRH